MIPYNTGLEKLILPEYGRIVHELTRQCVEIENREQRNAMASSIVELMKAAVQEKGREADEKKYWDHLFLISDKKLDIDYPQGTPSEELIMTTPKKLPYSFNGPDRRQYGKVLQQMVFAIAKMENGEDKDFLVDLIANHIKKIQTINNPESAFDEHVFSDLAEMSKGSIVLSPEFFTLLNFAQEKPQTKNQKKKKNR